ncbi:conserved hypothetical protein, partial [Ricinus communis]
AARHHAAVTGGHDPVALLDRIDAAQVFQLGIGTPVAGQDGAGVGAVDHHRRARGDVGQQQDAAGAGRDAHHATDQAALIQGRIADLDAALGAGVGQAGVGEGPPAVADHAGGGHRDRRIRAQAHQRLEALVLVLQGQGAVTPLAHLGQLGLQPAVLAGREEVAADVVQPQARPAPGRGDGAADRLGHHVHGLAGHAVRLVLEGLAAVGQQEGDGDDGRHDQGHRRRPGKRHLQVAEGTFAKGHELSSPGAPRGASRAILAYASVDSRTPFIHFGCSSTLPQPRATHDSGSSATVTGRPVWSRISASRPRSSAPPPVSMMPLSAMSLASSGGVASRATFTASTI